MNLFDSVDRSLLAAVLARGAIGARSFRGQARAGSSTVVLLSLAMASPLVGYLVDRIKRPRLLAFGFALWSLATVSTGLART